MDRHIKEFNRLVAMQQQDLQRLSQYSQEQLQRQPSEGKWSIIQVLNHLYIAQKGVMNYLDKKATERETHLKKTSLKNRLRSFALNRFLKSNKKARAPKSLPEPHNDTRIEDLRERFATMAAQGQKQIPEYPSEWKGKNVFKHPYVGGLSLLGTFSFMKNHWVHHQKQLHRLEEEIK